jgi:Flp pilus assembly protein protease CpaA
VKLSEGTMVQFFPSAVFGWSFVVVLLGLLAAAAWIDTKKLIVPKPLLLALIVCGVLMTVARGAMMGAAGVKTFKLADPTMATGMIDGVLFAAAGFAVGFGLFFLFWLLGVAGGGDVKVMAALGTWLGPFYVLGAVLFSFPVVVLLLVLGPVLGVTRTVAAARAGSGTKFRKQTMSYTLPLTIAVAAFLLLLFRADLGLVAPPTVVAQ